MKKEQVKKLDVLWAKMIRKVNCEWCGKIGNQHAHHIMSRRYRNTRWDLRNGVSLCAGCHLFRLKENPIEYTKWVTKYKTAKSISWLERRAKAEPKHKDYDTIKKSLLHGEIDDDIVKEEIDKNRGEYESNYKKMVKLYNKGDHDTEEYWHLIKIERKLEKEGASLRSKINMGNITCPLHIPCSECDGYYKETHGKKPSRYVAVYKEDFDGAEIKCDYDGKFVGIGRGRRRSTGRGCGIRKVEKTIRTSRQITDKVEDTEGNESVAGK